MIGVSADVYETTLRNEFLATTELSNQTYVLAPNNAFGGKPGPYPLYVTQTQHLGHSRYEGIELAVHRDPLVGLGFNVEGSLQRAYAHDLPAGFYNTASGPNAGQGYNSLSPSRVPHSQGYAELNAPAHNGSYLIVGRHLFRAQQRVQ